MDIALNVQYGRDDQLIFAQQLGVEQVVMTVDNYGEEVLAKAKNRVEKSALKLAGLEGLVLAGDVPGAGVDLDLAELDGTDPVAIINGYGDRLLMVRVGNVSAGREAFLNEGEIDLPSTLLALKRVGFVGPVRAGLPPGMVGDTEWGHKGRAYDLGYLKAVLQAIASL